MKELVLLSWFLISVQNGRGLSVDRLSCTDRLLGTTLEPRFLRVEISSPLGFEHHAGKSRTRLHRLFTLLHMSTDWCAKCQRSGTREASRNQLGTGLDFILRTLRNKEESFLPHCQHFIMKNSSHKGNIKGFIDSEFILRVNNFILKKLLLNMATPPWVLLSA